MKLKAQRYLILAASPKYFSNGAMQIRHTKLTTAQDPQEIIPKLNK